jgi:hypothetical protein
MVFIKSKLADGFDGPKPHGPGDAEQTAEQPDGEAQGQAHGNYLGIDGKAKGTHGDFQSESIESECRDASRDASC